MKRNYKENQERGKSDRSGYSRPSTRNQKQDGDKSKTKKRFFEDRSEAEERPDKGRFNRSKKGFEGHSERKQGSAQGGFGSRKNTRSHGEGRSSYHNRDSREKRDFNSKSPGRNSYEGKTDKPDAVEYKTVYRGRGKDQKPVYETVRKDALSQPKTAKKFFTKKSFGDNGPLESKPSYNFRKYDSKLEAAKGKDEIRLNKYIANAGVCSRREADTLIQNGQISVNGVVVTELGKKVLRTDRVQFQGKVLNPEKPVYVLLNKPKDFITTTDDPMERKTVMNLVSTAGEERIFPVGRLDRNTTGLLLFTNDGDLADKLASPAKKVKKIYQVTLDKPLTKNDAEAVLEGIMLEDGLAKVDDMQVLSLDRTILGLEIHIGRNRIVRRIFAALGYDVIALDRVVYAGLTKKDLPRGRYRYLTEKEVVTLKYFN